MAEIYLTSLLFTIYTGATHGGDTLFDGAWSYVTLIAASIVTPVALILIMIPWLLPTTVLRVTALVVTVAAGGVLVLVFSMLGGTNSSGPSLIFMLGLAAVGMITVTAHIAKKRPPAVQKSSVR